MRPDATIPAPGQESLPRLQFVPAHWQPTDRAVQLLAELLVRIKDREQAGAKGVRAHLTN